MGYEAVRMHARRGKIGGSYVKAHGRFVDRGAPRRRSRSMYVHGYRSSNPITVLWALAAVAVFGVVFVMALTVQAHRDSHAVPLGPAVVPSAAVTPTPVTSAPTCFPFQSAPC